MICSLQRMERRVTLSEFNMQKSTKKKGTNMIGSSVFLFTDLFLYQLCTFHSELYGKSK